ncbi:hypothetical protein CLW00_102364 [Mongoliibacter ruber]|uniref:Uncharacterized protein n=1 Tax=Mongoliibacter ruber TaxID=1750599 RepID=A0A2T0WT84_9BACT|nr:hypothetical protein CLW00_102364 [Mongoliibacter ruber]
MHDPEKTSIILWKRDLELSFLTLLEVVLINYTFHKKLIFIYPQLILGCLLISIWLDDSHEV